MLEIHFLFTSSCICSGIIACHSATHITLSFCSPVVSLWQWPHQFCCVLICLLSFQRNVSSRSSANNSCPALLTSVSTLHSDLLRWGKRIFFKTVLLEFIVTETSTVRVPISFHISYQRRSFRRPCVFGQHIHAVTFLS